MKINLKMKLKIKMNIKNKKLKRINALINRIQKKHKISLHGTKIKKSSGVL
jgi:hypothetical protein